MLNPSDLKFKVTVVYKFKNIDEAIKVRNLLKNHKYEVSGMIEEQSTYNHRQKRLNFIVNNLMGRTEPIDLGKFFSNCYGTHFNASYSTFARDVGILILQGKIKATSNIKKNTTLIEKVIGGKDV